MARGCEVGAKSAPNSASTSLSLPLHRSPCLLLLVYEA